MVHPGNHTIQAGLIGDPDKGRHDRGNIENPGQGVTALIPSLVMQRHASQTGPSG